MLLATNSADRRGPINRPLTPKTCKTVHILTLIQRVEYSAAAHLHGMGGNWQRGGTWSATQRAHRQAAWLPQRRRPRTTHERHAANNAVQPDAALRPCVVIIGDGAAAPPDALQALAVRVRADTGCEVLLVVPDAGGAATVVGG